MVNIENFDEKLEQDIQRVGAKVEQIKEGLESERFEKKEAVKQSVRKLADEDIQKETEEISSAKASEDEPSFAKASEDEKERYFPDYVEEKDVDEQTKQIIEALLQLTVDKGILTALRQSKKCSPFIQDVFHDALADKLIPELEKRGIL